MLAFIINTSLDDIPGCFRSGHTFRVGNITIATTLTDTLSPTTTYKIVLLPMALLIPFGIDDTTKDAINEATVYILDTTITGGSFWARHITELTPCNSTNSHVLPTMTGEARSLPYLFFPCLTSGQAWGTSPLI